MIFHEHLVYFVKLPRQIWESYYLKFNKRFPDSFAVSYERKGREIWWIEKVLFEKEGRV